MAYKTSYKNQNWLLPVSIKSIIPKNHICFLVEEFVESLDFSNFDMIYERAGAPAYHPRILVKILIHGMLSNERSSRKLESACRENIVFMYLSEKVNPNWRTICRFRKGNKKFISETFKETLCLASKHNLLETSFIATDGTTFKANANKKRVLKREQVQSMDSIVDKMIEEDIERDEIDELLQKKEENLTHMDKKDFRKIVSEYKKVKDKNKLKEKISSAKEEIDSNEKLKKVSLTDSESRMMQNKQRVRELSYNAQFSVDKNQMILSCNVCQDGHDVKQAIPQIEQVKENVKLNGDEKFSMDCGYSDEKTFHYCEIEGIDLYCPSRAQVQKFDGKEQSLNHDNYEYDEKTSELIVDGVRFQRRGSYERKDGKKIITFYNKKLKKKKDVPRDFKSRLRMKSKMETDEGRRVYALRKITVEPVVGQLKENFGLRQFSLRGLEGVRIEVNIASIAHNLKKIWKYRRENGEIMRRVKFFILKLD